MKIGWGSIGRAVIAGVVLFGVVGAVQALPVAAESGGYSATAHACQEGYSTLVGVKDGQITTFDTPGACVAYATRGGRIVVTSVVQPCLNGGYSALARSEDSTTAFISEAACVSYAAGGGILVPFVPFVVNPVFDVINLYDHGGYACRLEVRISGLAPSTEYTVTVIESNGEVSPSYRVVRSDSSGVLASSVGIFLIPDGRTVHLQVMLNGVPIGSPSGPFTVSC